MTQSIGTKRIVLDIFPDEIAALERTLYYGARSHLLRHILRALDARIRKDSSNAFIHDWLAGKASLVLDPLPKEEP